MKKQTIAIVAALLSVLMLFALAGCSSEPSDESGAELDPVGEPDIYYEEVPQLSHDSTPPTLTIETEAGGMSSATYATLGGYSWSWIDENGMTVNEEADAPSAAQMKTIATIKRSDTSGNCKLGINGGALHSIQLWKDGAKLEEGEKIELTGDVITFPEGGAYRYELIVDYEGGRVYYAFMITA